MSTQTAPPSKQPTTPGLLRMNVIPSNGDVGMLGMSVDQDRDTHGKKTSSTKTSTSKVVATSTQQPARDSATSVNGKTKLKQKTIAKNKSGGSNPRQLDGTSVAEGKQHPTKKTKKRTKLRQLINAERAANGRVPPIYLNPGPIEVVMNAELSYFISELARFYERARQHDPQGTKTKRRFLSGLREVERASRRGTLRCVILAPNVESVEAPGGLDDLQRLIIGNCTKKKIPHIVALSRGELARAAGKPSKYKFSAIGVVDWTGVHHVWRSVMSKYEDVCAERLAKPGVSVKPATVDKESIPQYREMDLVMAKWHDDGFWYRAEILGVSKPSASSETLYYHVIFIDYGNEQKDTTLGELAPLGAAPLPNVLPESDGKSVVTPGKEFKKKRKQQQQLKLKKKNSLPRPARMEYVPRGTSPGSPGDALGNTSPSQFCFRCGYKFSGDETVCGGAKCATPRIPTTLKTPRLLESALTHGAFPVYEPKTNKTLQAYEKLLVIVRESLGAQPREFLVKGVAGVLSILKDEAKSDPQKVLDVEAFLGVALKPTRFFAAIQAAKQITDYCESTGGGDDKLQTVLKFDANSPPIPGTASVSKKSHPNTEESDAETDPPSVRSEAEVN